MSKKTYRLTGIIILVIGIVLLCVPIIQVLSGVRNDVAAVSFLERLGLAGGYEQELQAGEAITIIDEKNGSVIDKIGRVVYPGDELINEQNVRYKVTRVRGNTAYAQKTGVAGDIAWNEEWETAAVGAEMNTAKAGADKNTAKAEADKNTAKAGADKNTVKAGPGKAQIAIYHTHTDESYVPTDGTWSIPAHGGIIKVGSALAAELKNKEVSVIDDKTPHDPHDANAYHRSRRTAVKLMQKMPMALLDIHRDGVPDPDFYNKKLQGELITRIRIVVGRQNPNMSANLKFAKDIKAYMDKHKPGLIKGIFIGRGDYNQDLSPRALLLEVGTHTNDRYRAERGADIFADAFPAVLNIKPAGMTGGGPGKTAPGSPGSAESKTSWTTVGWLIGIIIIGGAAFLFISTGSLKGMSSKLAELRKTEFANFFGLKKQVGRKKDGRKSDRETK